MSLMFAGGSTVYPQLTLPNWDSVASMPLSFWCWTYQADDAQFQPLYLADAQSDPLGCVQLYDYNTGNYVAMFHENWWDRVAVLRSDAAPGWVGWGTSFANTSSRSVYYKGAVGTNAGPTDHYPNAYTRFMFAKMGTSSSAVAEIAAWNYALTAADVTQLVAGRNPTTIQPSKLLLYLPLRTDVKDYGPSAFPVVGVGGWTPTYGGTHPPVDAYAATEPPPTGGSKHTPQFATVIA